MSIKRLNQDVGEKGGITQTNFDNDGINYVEPQTRLTNLNIAKEEWTDWGEPIKVEVKQNIESTATVKEEEWRLINTLSPNVRE